MKIYLASPFFKKEEIYIYKKVIDFLRKSGFDVFVPQEHTIPNGEKMPNHEWGKAVFEMDLKGLLECDVVVALNWGLYSDSGTAWECGFAYGRGIPVLNILCGQNDYSLMMLNGCGGIEDVIHYAKDLDKDYVKMRLMSYVNQK